MKLRCPIPKKFTNEGQVCILNQMFEENALGYAAGFHGGLDMRTQGKYKYKRNVPANKWDKEERTPEEQNGRIHLLAAHDGTMFLRLNEDKEKKGWGLYITADPIKSGADFFNVRYQTMYWHIETPWASLKTFKGFIPSIIELTKLFVGKKVKAGSIIAIAGNNGFSTGPHLHFELQRKTRPTAKAQWTDWEKINPIEYLMDENLLYQRYFGTNPTQSRWFYKGKEITRPEADEIKSKFTLV